MEQTAPELRVDDQVMIEGILQVIRHPGWTWADGRVEPRFLELRVRGKLVDQPPTVSRPGVAEW